MDSGAIGAGPDTSLAIHFNAFTGKLEGGYLYSHRAAAEVPAGGIVPMLSGYMRPAEVLSYLAANPETRCKPMSV